MLGGDRDDRLTEICRLTDAGRKIGYDVCSMFRYRAWTTGKTDVY